MCRLKLSDGTLLDHLTLNGNNFVTEEELTKDNFNGKLSFVEYMDDDGNTTMLYDMKLIKCQKWKDGKTWFVLMEKTEEQKEKERLEKENTLLKAQLRVLNDNIGFLEDCISEMGQVVYA